MGKHTPGPVILGYYDTREDAERAVALHNAAPELLEALKQVLTCVDQCSSHGMDDWWDREVEARARAVIAKATGGKQ